LPGAKIIDGAAAGRAGEAAAAKPAVAEK